MLKEKIAEMPVARQRNMQITPVLQEIQSSVCCCQFERSAVELARPMEASRRDEATSRPMLFAV